GRGRRKPAAAVVSERTRLRGRLRNATVRLRPRYGGHVRGLRTVGACIERREALVWQERGHPLVFWGGDVWVLSVAGLLGLLCGGQHARDCRGATLVRRHARATVHL